MVDVLPITDDRSRLLIPGLSEPETGSVVVTHGLHGTAWQLYRDGRWRPTRGRGSKIWDQILGTDRVYLVFEPSDERVPAPEVEPLPGSVVIVGEIAWQRFFSDGRWHPTQGGGSAEWARLFYRGARLAYEAPIRQPQRAAR